MSDWDTMSEDEKRDALADAMVRRLGCSFEVAYEEIAYRGMKGQTIDDIKDSFNEYCARRRNQAA